MQYTGWVKRLGRMQLSNHAEPSPKARRLRLCGMRKRFHAYPETWPTPNSPKRS